MLQVLLPHPELRSAPGLDLQPTSGAPRLRDRSQPASADLPAALGDEDTREHEGNTCAADVDNFDALLPTDRRQVEQHPTKQGPPERRPGACAPGRPSPAPGTDHRPCPGYPARPAWVRRRVTRCLQFPRTRPHCCYSGCRGRECDLHGGPSGDRSSSRLGPDAPPERKTPGGPKAARGLFARGVLRRPGGVGKAGGRRAGGPGRNL